MKYKSTLMLLVAVAIAGLVAYSLSKQPTTEELHVQRKRLLADFEAERIRRFVVQANGAQIVCQRETNSSDWRIVEPLPLRADRAAIERILDKLELAEKVTTIFGGPDEPLDMSQYGLDTPVRTLRLSESEGGPTWTLLVSDQGGVADTIYVAVEGQNAVYGIKQTVADATDVAVLDLRSKHLAPRIDTLELDAISLAAAADAGQPGFEATCEKVNGDWEIRRPFHDRADADAVKDIAEKVYGHRISPDDFVVDDPTKAAEYGLDDPDLTVTLKGGEKSQVLLLSRQTDGEDAQCYALLKGEPAVVRVPQTLFDDLRKSPADLRDRTVADVSVSAVAAIDVDGPALNLKLAKTDDAWRIESDAPVDADKEVIERVVRDLKAVRVQSFVADEPTDLSLYGLDEAHRTRVALKDKDGDVLAELFLGKADEDAESLYAMRPAYPPVLLLKAETCFEQLASGRLAFLNRSILSEETRSASELIIQRGKSRERCTRDEATNEWRLVEPVTAAAETWVVRGILADFADLRAEAFVAETADDLAQFGLKEPSVVATVTYPAADTEDEDAQPRSRMLYVGSSTSAPTKGYYAQVDGDSRVFILDTQVVERLNEKLGSKQICQVDELVAFTVSAQGKSERFTWDAEGSAWVDDSGDARDDAADVARLLRDFHGLRVADYAPGTPAAYGFDNPYLTVEVDDGVVKGKRIVVGRPADGDGRYVKGPATGFVHVAAAEDVTRIASLLQPKDAADSGSDPSEDAQP